MIKSVLVAALSVTLISVGTASPQKHSSRTHSKKESASKTTKSKSKKESSRKGSGSKSFDRGRRYVEEKATPVKHHTSSSSSKEIGRATIAGVNINVRSAPSSEASVVTKVSGGNAAIVAQKGDWYKLRFQYGTEGWVRQDFLKVASKSAGSKMIPIKLDSKPTATTVKNTTKPDSSGNRYANLVDREVNIRRGPSTSNSSAGKVKGGKVLVVDKWNDWYKVKFQHGTIGWVRNDFLVFPSDFDFKNDKNRPVVAAKTEPAKAPKTKPIETPRTATPENTVEVVATGERTSIEPEVKNASNAQPVIATVIGDNIPIRRGASDTNSVIVRIPGGKAELLDERGNYVQLKFEHGTIGWVKKDFVSYPGHIVTEQPPVYAGDTGNDKLDVVMKEAADFRNRRAKYIYGAASRGATDCSGFVLQVFKKAGIQLPRTAREQAQRGTKVGRWNLKAGDLIFFNTRGYISHVGIYIGDQHFVHASSGGGRVMESSLNEAYYSNRFLFGKRILPESKVKKLDLPSKGDLPTEQENQRDSDNTVDLSGNQKG